MMDSSILLCKYAPESTARAGGLKSTSRVKEESGFRRPMAARFTLVGKDTYNFRHIVEWCHGVCRRYLEKAVKRAKIDD
jgi:hypothetical protein